MKLFRRGSSAKDRRILPADAPQILAEFGLYEGPEPGGDLLRGVELGQLVGKVLFEESVEPEQILAEMVEATDAAGGWAYHGAWDILDTYTPKHKESEPFLYIFDRAIDNMLAHGYTRGVDLPLIMLDRLAQREESAS